MWLGVVTLFPEMFSSLKDQGIVSRAVNNGLIEFEFYNPRDFAEDNYRRVDDYSYGGGPGMVMKFATLEKAVTKARADAPAEALHVWRHVLQCAHRVRQQGQLRRSHRPDGHGGPEAQGEQVSAYVDDYQAICGASILHN